MAKKISQLTQATEVKSDDVTVIVQDGETKKLPLNMMVTKQDVENKKIAGLAKLDEIEATYENDTYTPTITVKNKSSVKTGEGDEVDYSANVMDGHVKSAILTGCTKFVSEKGGVFETFVDSLLNELVIGKTVNGANGIVVDNANEVLTVKFMPVPPTPFRLLGSKDWRKIALYDKEFNYIKTISFRTTEKIDITSSDIENAVYCRLGYAGTEIDSTFRITDTNNANIPYPNLVMSSVKMPVLTTTGKNLFDVNGLKNSQYLKDDGYIYIPIQLKPLTKYTFSDKNGEWNGKGIWLDVFDGEKSLISIIDSNKVNRKTFSFITNESLNFWIKSYNSNTDKILSTSSEFQIEEGSQATSYEPYKSNILTVNEEVELRGIGDVKDTLDCLTGEVVERIGEVVLNGSENWAVNNTQTTTTNRFILNGVIKSDMTDATLSWYMVDKLPKTKWSDSCQLGITLSNGKIFLFNNSIEYNISALKSWLSQNPITIQYQLKTESIKTVDLMPSGTHPSTTPYCWKNGHIQLSSSGLLPNLEYSVVTSRAGQINQNATMIVKNDKRIFDLEILLAGGLVNTTYQALTLQNQVETGLSKVSLSSETEPDYLLYHMIMKLIEEKAYKLDDLTEKVSVFYLYEKLSDEQFETIYSALYPFVEDEIVEEPVVEELPEVVEDEVIM